MLRILQRKMRSIVSDLQISGTLRTCHLTWTRLHRAIATDKTNAHHMRIRRHLEMIDRNRMYLMRVQDTKK